MERLSPLSVSLHANANISAGIIYWNWGIARASGASSFCGVPRHSAGDAVTEPWRWCSQTTGL